MNAYWISIELLGFVVGIINLKKASENEIVASKYNEIKTTWDSVLHLI